MLRKHIQASIPGLALAGMLLVAASSQAQPAKGANKFLGNITTNGKVRSDFLTYWNQIGGENEFKWQSVENTRDKMNWAGADSVANFGKRNNIAWKFHTLIWGSQYPTWMDGLSQTDQLAEITEWFDAAAARYPDVTMIDVVNEAYENGAQHHAPAPFKNALGGNGTTGFDYIIKAFQMARQRWPKAILIYNDYNTIEYDSENNWVVKLANAMKAANAPMDAIGVQAHGCAGMSSSKIKSYLDKIAATGYPIFVTEYDISNANDASQLSIIKDQFTMFWNHPKVAGITYWGYLMGATWVANTGLLNTNGTERSALTWMKDFVKNNPNPPNDFPNLLKVGPSSAISKVASTGLNLNNTMRPKLMCSPKLGVYLSNNRNEKFSLGGKKMQENSINLIK